jgi:HAD superfamily hydrolase (TIGR01549 family)
MIKGILLDLDDTLYAYPACDAAGQAAAFAFLAEKLSHGKSLKINKRKVAKNFALARGIVKKQIPETGASHSRLLYFQNTIEQLTGCSIPAVALATESIFWKAYFKKMKLRPGVKPFLLEMKKRSVKIAVVSDFTTAMQIKKLQRLGIDRYIDILVTSEESGRDKPAPDSFRLALKKLNLRTSEVVMVGDDQRRDRIGADRLKIRFFEITALKDFVKIVMPD